MAREPDVAQGAAADGSAVLVREVLAEDWAVMRALRLRALATDPEAFGSTLEREQGFDEDTWRARCERGGQFVAWGAATCDDGLEPAPIGLVGGVIHEGEPEVVSMWVAPEARDGSVAAALLQVIIDRFTLEGWDHIVLWVTEVNERAQRFYARHGFTPTSDSQPVRDGEDPMELKMRRDLV